MIDIHTHLLFGVDDGVKTIEKSIEALKKAEEVGFNTIILTPHYIEGTSYDNLHSTNLIKFNELVKESKKNNINIKLLLGCEIYSKGGITSKIITGEISTLGSSKYILVEFPTFETLREIETSIHNIKIAGYIPIIAHIERYTNIYDNIEAVDELIKMGAIIQVNAYSFLKKYGTNSYKIAKKLLKQDKIDILSTDAHHISQYSELYKVEKKINKLKKGSFNKLFKDNIEKLKIV